ncbi:heterokaryon incompatibility protein-domain-containing protein [Paraphoma chrysanthemicola]|uniref:Heterokaryon incompatibility protein-domain-containing protein n=1 Tax=Paraphoma chrysanthemicola TaxID=798071 RepID=A0A8K0VSM9_9PLEO|nr:heterokaryon incompatibility protein-domain-containing protein [Paraphoma chrysanthemicola]
MSGALRDFRGPGYSKISKTIEDAIQLTRLLKFQYLWVDALCIVQDDPADQQIQIKNMHGVYETAFLTIVAASGEPANAGLPGLAPDTRGYEQREVIVVDSAAGNPGLSLVTTVKKNPQSWDRSFAVGQGDLETSAWNRRAWTMQEKVLSRRTITFSDEQGSFFEIRNFHCRSFIKTSYHELSLSSLAQPTPPWNLYRDLFEGDYSDALAAVIEMLHDTKGERFIWGLPCSRFGLALSRAGLGWGELATRIVRLEMTVRRGSDISVTYRDVKKHTPELTSDTLTELADDYVLFFWADTARFLVEIPAFDSFENTPSTSKDWGSLRPVIYNAIRKRVGTACAVQNDHSSSTKSQVHRAWHDFVAIGRRDVPEIPEFSAQILALQIEWRKSIAYRMNMAEIDEVAWVGAAPRKNLIALA